MINCYHCGKEQEQDIYDDEVIVVFCSVECLHEWWFAND